MMAASEAILESSTKSKQLEFSGPVYAALLPAHYLLETIKNQSRRPSGRATTQFREPSVNLDSLTYSNGSAVVRIGGTTCVCGVRAEIASYDSIPNPPIVDINAQEDAVAESEELASLNLIVPNVDIGTGCMASIPPGQAPTGLAQALADRLRGLLAISHMFHASDLRILYTPPKAITEEDNEPDVLPQTRISAYWCLYIDTVFISADGNLFDAAWLAVLTALHNTKIPKARWDPDLEMVLCSEHEVNTLRLRSMPVAVSFAVFEPTKEKGLLRVKNSWILADPDAFEETLCKEVISVVCDGSRIVKILKSGGIVVNADEMRMISQLAAKRWQEMMTILNRVGNS